MVLLQGTDVVFGDSIVNVQGLGELVNVAGFFAEKSDDLSPVRSSPGPCENIP